MTLIISNLAVSHIQEANSFLDAITKYGDKAEVYITDKNSHKVGRLNIKKIFNSINFFKIFSLLKKIEDDNITKLIITAPIPFLLPLFMLSKKSVTVMYTLHEPYKYDKSMYSFLTNLFHRYFLKYVDILIFYSEYAENQYLELNKDSANKTIYKLPLYRHRHKREKPLSYDKKKYISMVGDLGYHRDLNFIIEIAKKLPHEQFLLAGRGNIDQYLEDIQNTENIILINRFLDEDEFNNFIDESKFLLLPYKSVAQSGVLLDSMCRGTIPVVTKVGSFEEFIENNENGFIFPYTSFCDDFVMTYKQLTKDEIIKISQASLDYYNSNVSFDIFYKKFLEIYIKG